MRQIYSLMESTPTHLHLTLEQARGLMALGRRLSSQRAWWGGEKSGDTTVIRCEPSGIDTWKVTVTDAVGCVAVGDAVMTVAPKISTPHALYLLEESKLVPRLADSLSRLAGGSSLADLFAWWFVQSAERVIRLGISRGYREARDSLTCVIGKLDVVETSERSCRGLAEAVCDYEEFDEDAAHNRVLRSAAQVVARNADLPHEIRQRARSIARELEVVGALRSTDPHAFVDRTTLHYRESLVFAKALLAGAGVAIDAGGQIAHSFLVRTPELIEAGMRCILQNDLGETFRIEKRKKQSDVGDVTFNPDIVIDEMAVADVKYRHFGVDWSRSDLNQALAFATVFGAKKAAVLGFVSSTQDHTPRGISVAGHSVKPIAWLATDDIAPVEARHAFVSHVRRWLQEGIAH